MGSSRADSALIRSVRAFGPRRSCSTLSAPSAARRFFTASSLSPLLRASASLLTIACGVPDGDEHGVERGNVEFGQALLVGSRYIRQQRAALFGGDRQRLDVSCLDLAQRAQHGIAFIIDLTRQHGVQDGGGAGEWDHRRLDADRRMQKQTADIGYRAQSGVSDIELFRVGLCVGHEFLEVVGREILSDDQQFRIFGGQPNRFKILLRIVGEVRVERRRQRIGAEVSRQNRISIRRRTGGADRPRRSAGAYDILHHEFLAQVTAEDVSDDPASNIGWPAGGKRNDNRGRPGGIILSPCVTYSSYCHHGDGRCCQMPSHQSPPRIRLFIISDVTYRQAGQQQVANSLRGALPPSAISSFRSPFWRARNPVLSFG